MSASPAHWPTFNQRLLENRDKYLGDTTYRCRLSGFGFGSADWRYRYIKARLRSVHKFNKPEKPGVHEVPTVSLSVDGICQSLVL